MQRYLRQEFSLVPFTHVGIVGRIEDVHILFTRRCLVPFTCEGLVRTAYTRLQCLRGSGQTYWSLPCLDDPFTSIRFVHTYMPHSHMKDSVTHGDSAQRLRSCLSPVHHI